MKKNIRLITGILIGLLIGGSIAFAVADSYSSNQITFDNSNTTGLSDNVQDALVELYGMAENSGGDSTPPTGSLAVTRNNYDISATVTVNDSDSGPRSIYGWKVSTSATCDSSVSDFLISDNNTYTYTASSLDTYYVCVRIEDNKANFNYISESATIDGINCSAGTYFRASDASCQTCPAGYYCEGWSGIPDSSDHGKTACSAGTYNKNTGSSSSSACTRCVVGSYSSSAGSSSCTPCSAGKFAPINVTGNSTSCISNCTQTHVSTWYTPSWNSSNNTVSNICSVNTCASGYTKSNNICVASGGCVVYCTSSSNCSKTKPSSGLYGVFMCVNGQTEKIQLCYYGSTLCDGGSVGTTTTTMCTSTASTHTINYSCKSGGGSTKMTGLGLSGTGYSCSCS